jgi:hypothetical protein
MSDKSTSGKQESVSLDRLKLFLDFAKWFVGSVVIGLITFFLSWGLKERSQGLAEMKEYSKHINMIVSADSLDQKYRLAQFFSSVTVSDDLRDGWKRYYELICIERKRIDSLQRILDTLSVGTPQEQQAKKSLKTLQSGWNTSLLDKAKVSDIVPHTSLVELNSAKIILAKGSHTIQDWFNKLEGNEFQEDVIDKWKYDDLARLIYLLKADIPVFFNRSVCYKCHDSYKEIDHGDWNLENIKADPKKNYSLWQNCMTGKERDILARMINMKNSPAVF